MPASATRNTPAASRRRAAPLPAPAKTSASFCSKPSTPAPAAKLHSKLSPLPLQPGIGRQGSEWIVEIRCRKMRGAEVGGPEVGLRLLLTQILVRKAEAGSPSAFAH